jgi:hypothetical protein
MIVLTVFQVWTKHITFINLFDLIPSHWDWGPVFSMLLITVVVANTGWCSGRQGLNLGQILDHITKGKWFWVMWTFAKACSCYMEAHSTLMWHARKSRKFPHDSAHQKHLCALYLPAVNPEGYDFRRQSSGTDKAWPIKSNFGKKVL